MYGISSDSVETHAAWRDEESLPFHLLADCDADVRASYGVPRAFVGLVPGRATFVITPPDGRILGVHAAQLDFESHAEEALRMVRELRGQ